MSTLVTIRKLWSRRQFVSTVGSVAAVRAMSSAKIIKSAPVLAAETSLRDLASAKGLLYGCSAGPGQLATDPAFAHLVAEQCSLLVAENSLNWRYTEPRPGGFDFHLGDSLATFAKEHNMRFGGGTLVWHDGLPQWFTNLPPQSARNAMVNHVTQVISHYRRQVFSWTVVNEALAFRGQGTLRDTPFLRLVGPDYIETSFRAAAAADPSALLVLNDSYLEYDIPEGEFRRNTLLKLLQQMVERKVPIGALGLQSHLRTGGVPFNGGKLRDFLHRVSDLGLKIVVSELDVAEKGPETDVSARDNAVAKEIDRYLEVILQEKSVVAIVTWGLTARYSWLAAYAPRSDGQQVRPLPYDSELRPTAARQALATAFDHAPGR
jgi:endo-1,4-beta-xylanase